MGAATAPPDHDRAVPPGPVLVTGGDGQLGRELVAAAARVDRPLVALGRRELDVADAGSIHAACAAIDPAAIIHAAAWTDVDGAEASEQAAAAINDTGTRLVVAEAARLDIPVVAVSTDYVFPGDAPQGYVEDDEPAPQGAYGRTKRAGELHVLDYERGLVARTAWLFSEHGSNFVRTMDVLTRSREAVDVVADQVGSPTWARHLADALLACLDRELTGIVHLAGEPAVSWHGLAQAVVDANGSGCEVRPVGTEAFPRPAPRPACSILRSTRPDAPVVGPWADGVRAVVRAWELART